MLGVSLDGAAADQFRIIATPSPIAPNGVGEVFLAYEPTGAAEHSATLTLTSDALNTRIISWTLQGTTREPCRLEAGPSFQNFLLGEIKTVTITAGDNYKCTITSIAVDRGIFDVVNEPELPFDIPAGESFVLEVQHTEPSISASGAPTRDLLIRELEGTEARVFLAGEPPVFGCLEAFPPQVNFGRFERGLQRVEVVRVRNTCAERAAVTSVAMTDGFYFYSVDNTGFPRVLDPLESTDIVVTYEAFSPQGDRGLLTINTNDARNQRFRIDLYGEADLPLPRVLPESVDFGAVVFRNPQGPQMRSECSSGAQIVKVYSAGAAAVRVSKLEITEDSDPFFLVSSVVVDGQPIFDLNQDIVIPPGSVMEVALQFAPTRSDPSEHTGVLRIEHNGDTGVSDVRLRGRGVPDGPVTDVFTQLEGPTVDILWVIDDSCSMYDEQARLISNLSQFVGYADSQDADYQMAVTVTDSRSNSAGKFRRCFPHPPIISGDYADQATREEAFECTFLVGANSISFFEAGLGAAQRALERATSTTIPVDENANLGFLRPQAKLAIVAVSDEEDQSAESQELLRDYFWSVKGFNRRDRVQVHAIAGPTQEDCAQGTRFAEPGYRYEWMTQQTGGIFFNICESDWQPLLSDLGLGVFTPLNEWDLSQLADPGTMQVAVDGVSIRNDALNGYVFLPDTNSVRFNGTSVPVPGAEVVIDYSGLCRP